ncbi:hypothetical protein NDU88_002821 [Pleurodeles waltl]|uniref:Uncharacterized protein n=1 Tax=Pleurodeles waltl TaxID=8319 RepID=A0AAV7SED6_PLEWA|nr:hypothetical protein NDU88_002821 [Pleurodeles waltl]
MESWGHRGVAKPAIMADTSWESYAPCPAYPAAYRGFEAGGAHAAGVLNSCGSTEPGDLGHRLPWAAQSCIGPGPRGSAACRAQVSGRRRLDEARG